MAKQDEHILQAMKDVGRGHLRHSERRDNVFQSLARVPPTWDERKLTLVKPLVSLPLTTFQS